MKKISLAVPFALILVAVAVLLLMSHWCAPATQMRDLAVPLQEQRVANEGRGGQAADRMVPVPSASPSPAPQPQKQPDIQAPPTETVEAPPEPPLPYLRSPWAMLGLLREMEPAIRDNFVEEMEALETLIALREDLTFETEENAHLGRPNPPELAQEFADMEEEERALMEELAARPELQKYFNYSEGQN